MSLLAPPSANYPLSSPTSLKLQYVGAHLKDVPAPIPVIDRAVVKKNCQAMLDVCSQLGVGFRAHVKSHKTLELAKLQVGEEGPADFIVSTVIEAENLMPLLLEYQGQGRKCSVLYGVPIPQSAIPRLVRLAKPLQPFSVNVIVDNEDAFNLFWDQMTLSPDLPKFGVFIKIDTGYHRAGIKTENAMFESFVRNVKAVTKEGFKGFYSHLGHSYSGSSEQDALRGLTWELNGLKAATTAVAENGSAHKLTLTVGATPTATAAQNILAGVEDVDYLRDLIAKLSEKYTVELHAGVYPLLDLQQVATHARPASKPSIRGFESLSVRNIGMKILVEVTSLYDDRDKPEVLIAAGTLAFGREPCKSYPGWGIVSNVISGELDHQGINIYEDQGNRSGWIIGKISQEHGILTWEGPKEKVKYPNIGDKLLVWPNHACVAGAGFGWYLVVDSDRDSNKVVDVWVRWRGW